jgi:hypothetical protein
MTNFVLATATSTAQTLAATESGLITAQGSLMTQGAPG